MRLITDKLFQLLWSVQEDHKGLLKPEDISAIKKVIYNRIHEIKTEESSFDSSSPDCISHAEQARYREKTGFGM